MMCRFHLRKIFIANQCHKFKTCLILLVFVAILFSGWFKWARVETPKSSVNLTYVTVHIDLKGSPPKIQYLTSLLYTFKQYGVNSILMEYEDMFPYEKSIVNISSVNCYKREELSLFLYKARQYEIEIIPLVQTFGHMEFVLKLEQFAHLREEEMHPADICPSNNRSTELITTMLEQVIDFHTGIHPLKHIHIGCDEVKNLNKCQKCRKRKLKDNVLFFDHIKKVSGIVKKNNPNTKILIWADMFTSNKKNKPIYIDNVEAVEWAYSRNPDFSNTNFYNLHKQFQNIWIASAFKGADGMNAMIPDMTNRFLNHLSWMRFILDYKFGGETRVYNFKGIILTGWSRYTHMTPQCELLPVAMPSLILNLLLINKVKKGIDKSDLYNMEYCEFYIKYLKEHFEDVFGLYDDSEKVCPYENTQIYVGHKKMFDPTPHETCIRQLQTYASQCRFGTYSDKYNLEHTINYCNSVLKHLFKIKQKQTKFMTKYYTDGVIRNYIDETIHIHADTIMRLINDIIKENCTEVRYWKRRS